MKSRFKSYKWSSFDEYEIVSKVKSLREDLYRNGELITDSEPQEGYRLAITRSGCDTIKENEGLEEDEIYYYPFGSGGPYRIRFDQQLIKEGEEG